jgi:hypothetical protein
MESPREGLSEGAKHRTEGPVPEARARILCPCSPPPKTGERHQPRMRGAMGSGRMMRGGLPQRAL